MCVCGFLGLFCNSPSSSSAPGEHGNVSNEVMKHKASSEGTWGFFTFQPSACSISNRCRWYHQTGYWLRLNVHRRVYCLRDISPGLLYISFLTESRYLEFCTFSQHQIASTFMATLNCLYFLLKVHFSLTISKSPTVKEFRECVGAFHWRTCLKFCGQRVCMT